MEYSDIKEGMTGAVIVLYNPDFELLRKGLGMLKRSVDVLCLVDNSATDNSAKLDSTPNAVYVPLLENRGIAAAQNVGLRILKERGVEYVLFSDQDSLAAPDTVDCLKHTYKMLCAKGVKTGGVGTRAVNIETGKPYPSKAKEYEVTEVDNGNNVMQVTRCSYIRASISLMRLSSFVEIGGYDETLFIDGVDNEWCWRAATKGYKFYIAESAKIVHHLGEGDRHVAGRNLSISSAFRIYYQFRNYIWLCRRNYVPLWWKRKHLLKYAVKMIYYPLCVSPRVAFAKGILRGIKDGVLHCRKPDFGKIE